ncbi:PAS domain S-box protein [Arenibacter algicola]|uniref:PAS domain-containing protein n=1 Tax=Arenibacter algicola TaxID=616991 RepID=UPI001C06D4D1|nr:PAS domain S-box protein [Arenibacter algicola]MBU2905965.1 PAS domain S-box protein [Arenibacter algicola]
MVHKSGEIVFLNIKISESRINDKAVLTELDGEIQDITTQKKVWEQIDLINPGYTSVLQAGYNWLTIVDIDGNYIYVNKALEKALGYSSEELIGQNIFSFVHESDNGKAANHFSKFINNKPFVSKPFRFRCKNGSWRWIEILMVDLYGDPMIQGIVINARDITERVLINKEIKASEEKHRLLFNTSPFPKYILEPNSFKIVDVNDAMMQFYGYTREELLTMSAKDLRPNEEIDKLVQASKTFNFRQGP